VGLKPISVATGFLQCFDAVGWVTWPVKIVSRMIHKVSSGTFVCMNCSLDVVLLLLLLLCFANHVLSTACRYVYA